jgi:hypothetical protein
MKDSSFSLLSFSLWPGQLTHRQGFGFSKITNMSWLSVWMASCTRAEISGTKSKRRHPPPLQVFCNEEDPLHFGHQMCCKSSNLVAYSLGKDTGTMAMCLSFSKPLHLLLCIITSCRSQKVIEECVKGICISRFGFDLFKNSRT